MSNKTELIDQDIQCWLEEFNSIQKEILQIGPFRKGSINERWQTCSTPNCKCKLKPEFKHGPYYFWTTKKNAKTVTILLPKNLLDEANIFRNNAKLFNQKIAQLSDISEKIIRRKLTLSKKLPKN